MLLRYRLQRRYQQPVLRGFTRDEIIDAAVVLVTFANRVTARPWNIDGLVRYLKRHPQQYTYRLIGNDDVDVDINFGIGTFHVSVTQPNPQSHHRQCKYAITGVRIPRLAGTVSLPEARPFFKFRKQEPEDLTEFTWSFGTSNVLFPNDAAYVRAIGVLKHVYHLTYYTVGVIEGHYEPSIAEAARYMSTFQERIRDGGVDGESALRRVFGDLLRRRDVYVGHMKLLTPAPRVTRIVLSLSNGEVRVDMTSSGLFALHSLAIYGSPGLSLEVQAVRLRRAFVPGPQFTWHFVPEDIVVQYRAQHALHTLHTFRRIYRRLGMHLEFVSAEDAYASLESSAYRVRADTQLTDPVSLDAIDVHTAVHLPNNVVDRAVVRVYDPETVYDLYKRRRNNGTMLNPITKTPFTLDQVRKVHVPRQGIHSVHVGGSHLSRRGGSKSTEVAA